jgi:hypothetical protein
MLNLISAGLAILVYDVSEFRPSNISICNLATVQLIFPRGCLKDPVAFQYCPEFRIKFEGANQIHNFSQAG